MKTLCRVLALTTALGVPAAMMAQDSGAPAAGTASAVDSPSKWDIFLGYSYLAPKGSVQTTLTDGTTPTLDYHAQNKGAIESVAYYFNNNVGVEGIADQHSNSPDAARGFSAGLILRLPMEDMTPFIHGLIGVEYTGLPGYQPGKWGPAVTAGGGVDYRTPLFNHHLSIRVFQADFQYYHVNFGPGLYGGRANVKAARLSAGIVFNVGNIAPPAPVTLACSASPTSVFPGDPVAVTATAGALDPKDHVVYGFSGDGVTGKDASATVNTADQAPGTYTVKCNVKEGKAGKEGLKPWQSAEATTTYTVKQYEPPTVSCSANPSDLKPGDTSTITAAGVSPQNRPLTYSYTAASGTVTGSGNTATFSSAGAPTGPVEVTCNVSDDKGQTASANATVTVEAPPPPPGPSPEQVQLEHRLALHSVFFPTSRPSEAHPEGGLLESQQATLNSLATDFKAYLAIKPDAKLVLTGHTDPRGSVKFNQALSERRVNRVEEYLVQQGISQGSIETRAMGEDQQLSTDQVKSLVDENTDLTATERQRILHNLRVIVLAQNRRVDIRLSTTGQESTRLYPFNADDAKTLLSEKAPVHKGKPGAARHRKHK
ncbi:MAG TPA: OmpA family protein [Terracidiphilus sp.]|nr:OmpA family protein [Terracidiphilus sp.]